MARECGNSNHWAYVWSGALLSVRKVKEPTKLIDAGFSTNLNMRDLELNWISFSEVKNLTVFVSKFIQWKKHRLKMIEFINQNKNWSRNKPIGGQEKSHFLSFFGVLTYMTITCDCYYYVLKFLCRKVMGLWWRNAQKDLTPFLGPPEQKESISLRTVCWGNVLFYG